jgi:hypothetical protein
MDALDWQPQVIKFTSCLPMVSGSFRVLRLLPPWSVVLSGFFHPKTGRHDKAEILPKVVLKH